MGTENNGNRLWHSLKIFSGSLVAGGAIVAFAGVLGGAVESHPPQKPGEYAESMHENIDTMTLVADIGGVAMIAGVAAIIPSEMLEKRSIAMQSDFDDRIIV